jgi:small subunit ribosomal protein S9
LNDEEQNSEPTAEDETPAQDGPASPADDQPAESASTGDSEPEAAAEDEAPAEAQAPAEEVAAEEVPAEVAEEPAEEPPAAQEPTGEAPAAEEPESASEAPVAEDPAQAEGDASATAAEEEPEYEELPEEPRAKPEIPGLELEPDVAPEADQYLDAEAQAAAEAEAEAAAARALAESDAEESSPIADAAIDLGAGARYVATGKRKTAVARVILKPGKGEYSINGRPLESMFPRETLQRMIRQPLETVGYDSRMDVVARMHGGGVSAQAGALRHGISRALIDADPNLRGELKRRGFLTRDPRVKERKKAGLKKARKRPQFSKR